jgi:hypothetical protein
MSNTQDSKDKNILQKVNFKEFTELCSEYDEVKKSLKKLIKIRDNPETPVRVQVDVSRWIIEMNIGKPKQIQEVDLNKPVTVDDFIARLHKPDTPYDEMGFEENYQTDANGFVINPNLKETGNE